MRRVLLAAVATLFFCGLAGAQAEEVQINGENALYLYQLTKDHGHEISGYIPTLNHKLLVFQTDRSGTCVSAEVEAYSEGIEVLAIDTHCTFTFHTQGDVKVFGRVRFLGNIQRGNITIDLPMIKNGEDVVVPDQSEITEAINTLISEIVERAKWIQKTTPPSEPTEAAPTHE